MLYTIGYIAMVPALLSMVGAVVLLFRYKPWQLRSFLKSNVPEEADKKAVPQERMEVQEEIENVPPPRQPEVVVRLPEAAMARLEQIWATTPAKPAGWFVGGFGQ